MPAGVSDLAVGDGYESGAEPELVWLLVPCSPGWVCCVAHAACAAAARLA